MISAANRFALGSRSDVLLSSQHAELDGRIASNAGDLDSRAERVQAILYRILRRDGTIPPVVVAAEVARDCGQSGCSALSNGKACSRVPSSPRSSCSSRSRVSMQVSCGSLRGNGQPGSQDQASRPSGRNDLLAISCLVWRTLPLVARLNLPRAVQAKDAALGQSATSASKIAGPDPCTIARSGVLSSPAATIRLFCGRDGVYSRAGGRSQDEGHGYMAYV